MSTSLEQLTNNAKLVPSLVSWAKEDITQLILAGAKETCFSVLATAQSTGDAMDSFALGSVKGYAKALEDLEALGNTTSLEEDTIDPSYTKEDI